MEIVPVIFRDASAFVKKLHRHNKPPQGHKFSIGLEHEGRLVGVAMAGRPIARGLDDGRTLEVVRTCTDGTDNANSMLYGAVWRAGKAMGFLRAITYTQHSESGASLKAAGWVIDAELPARKSWRESSKKFAAMRDEVGSGGVARIRWKISVLQRYPSPRDLI